MLHDIEITPEQAVALGHWVDSGKYMAGVLLRVDDGILHIAQGDDRRSFQPNGWPVPNEEVPWRKTDFTPTEWDELDEEFVDRNSRPLPRETESETR